jgi:type IV pilus assembly protein PilY1
MELDALTGKRLSTTATGLGAPWDINQDGMINSSDLITITINGVVTLVAPSGKKSTVGGVDTPGVITSGQLEYKYTSGTSGQMEVTTESRGTISGSGRKSWRQIFE